MPAFEVSRTLVKSPPEVWAELEKVERLAELFDDGEITITRRQPETEIEWQGAAATGKIEIAASGWGTKVRLTAETETVAESSMEPEDEPEPEPDAAPESEAAVVVAPEPERKPSFWKNLKSLFSSASDTAPEEGGEDVFEDVLESEPVTISEPKTTSDPHADADSTADGQPLDFEARLTAVLDHLGAAHKRPFTAS